MADNCRICSAESVLIAGNELAHAKLFPDPAFDNHLIVGTTAHKDLGDVTPPEWQGIGELIGQLTRDASGTAGYEKMYLLAIGDVDKGHFHLHMVPKGSDDPGMGPFIFGADGWNARRKI